MVRKRELRASDRLALEVSELDDDSSILLEEMIWSFGRWAWAKIEGIARQARGRAP